MLAGLVALGAVAQAGATPTPVPVLSVPATTPASASSWTFTWPAILANSSAGTIEYQYCVVAAAATPCPGLPQTTAAPTATVTVADGSWFFKVNATETPAGTGSPGLPNPSLFGNVAFAADTTAAPPTIAGPVTGSLLNAAPTYTLTGEPGASFAWSFTPAVGLPLPGAGPSALFSATTNPLEPIAWTFSATQTDTLGNTSLAAVRTFTIDRVPPGAAIISPNVFGVAGNLTNSPPVVTIGGGGEPVTYRYSIDGGPTVVAPGAPLPTINLASLADGPHTLAAWTVDTAGNVALAPNTTLVFTIDRSAPPLPIITGSLADGTFTPSVPSYTLGGSEVGATYLWSLLGPSPIAEQVGTTVTLGALPTDGLYTVRARTRDAAGNLSGFVLRTFNLDRVAPASPTMTPEVLDIVNTPPDTTLTGGGEPVTYRWRINAGVIRVGNAVDLAGLADGAHVLEAWSVDRAGNESAKTVRAFTLDRKAPDPPNITEPPAATNRVPRPTITGEPKTTIFWSLSGPRSISDSGPATVAPVFGALPDGDYVLQAYARTPAGNRSGTVRVAFRLDTDTPAPPVILSGPSSPRGGPRPQFTWTGEPGAVFVWQVMREDLIIQGPARTNSTGTRVSTLATGRYSLRLTQVDAAGNTSEQGAPWIFEIQGRPAPKVAIEGTLAKKRLLVKSYGPLSPRSGRVVSFGGRTELRWIYRSGRPAKVFNVQIFDENGRKILSRFPAKPQFTVPRRILKTGKRYYWQIWPYWGPALGYAKRPLGVSYFDVRPSAKQIKAAISAGVGGG